MSKILYLGHSATLILKESGNIVIDPFLDNNPLSPMKSKDVKAKYILITHGHEDHLGDTVSIAKENNSTVITNFELGVHIKKLGVEDVVMMNIGGTYRADDFSVKMVFALHSSSYEVQGNLFYGGTPAGFVVKLQDLTIYHAGDTGLFMDMSLIGSENTIDVALLPIGGFYTMDIDDAVFAVKLLHPKYVVPIHYNTWDEIKVNVEEFKERLEKETRSTCIALKPGEGF